ncbi:RNA-directed DNA polymerase, eukaryota, reverse transcriptase zinc-binding domain protein [Tanacetum coccineum]
MESLFQCKLNSVEADYMVREVSNEEIKAALFQIDDNKVPGLYGYSAAFFKKAWNVIGNDVCLAVKEFFKTRKILREINSTLIALVPKIQTPLKCLTLDPLLVAMLYTNASVKHIHDNIMLAQELFKGYDRKSGPKRFVVKVDIQKAYDTVNWQFLESILIGFGLYPKMVQWIMRCVSTTSFSICINGQSCGYFKGGKGLRQGDPISSYLFTLVMEILTLIIKRKVDQSRDFQYHFGCKKLKVTNVCFADDLLIYCHADKNSLKVLKESIDEFGKVAGLIPNYNKSTIIFGSLDDDERKELLEVMPFKVEKLPIRLMLVASVLETIYVYWASVFLLPVGVIEDINKLLKNFLWQQNDGTKRRAKVAWKNVCKFKQKGGLGLKDLRVKWINTEKLRGRSVWEVDVDINDSWGWKNIGNLRKEVRKFMYSKIGDGNRTSVWENGKLCKFSVKQAYEDLLEDTEDVGWWKMIWFSQNIPKHAFISWMAVLNKLTTQDKIKQCGSYDVMRCALCKNDTDSHSHLFFECEFSKTIWEKVTWKIGVDWKENNRCNNERNNRIFRDEMRSSDEIYKTLEDIIRMRIMSLKVKNSVAVKKAQEVWNVKLDIIDNSDIQLQAPCILESTGCDCTH